MHFIQLILFILSKIRCHRIYERLFQGTVKDASLERPMLPNASNALTVQK